MMASLATGPVAADAPELHEALTGAQLPIEDLTDGGRMFYRFESEGRTVGYGGLELYGEDALLRSVVVLPEARGTGMGRAVTEGVLARAYEAGARHAYLLTTTAEGFFSRLGFVPVDREAAPAAILATRQATTICSSAALLRRALTPRG
jgi:N-acetylglutamate synthase-like GNAT family acetyltransferase